MNQLESLGCQHLLIVVGEHAQAIEELINDQYTGKATLEFIPNTMVERGNGYSLHLGLKKLFGHVESLPTPSEPEQPSHRFCHLVMSDHVYDAAFVAQVQEYLHAGNYPSTLFVDPHIQQIFDLDDATKVLHEEGKLQELGKTLTHYNALDTGWFILDAQMLDISRALAKHQRQFGVSSVIDAYQKHLRFHCESIDQGRWQDVDNPAMFEAATKLFS
jgi:choline kinase